MTAPAPSFYRSLSSGRFAATRCTAGPWSSTAQHGSPPAALLARSLESVPDDGTDRAVGRFTMDLLGPVPVTELGTSAGVLRPGRSVSLRQAELFDGDGRVLARAQGWLLPGAPGPGGPGVPLDHGPRDGEPIAPPETWLPGYLDSVEWRWVSGSVLQPGPAVVWMRPLVPLVDGEEPSPLQRLLLCVDSASGVSAALDPRQWSFLNTELTVHVLRPMVGEWLCLQAETTLGPGSVAIAVSEAYDEQGFFARSAQTLLVQRAR